MAENSNIEWTDHTFNGWIGCTKVHAGCANCYAEADQAIRRGRVVWGSNGTRSKTKTWGDPVKWNRKAPLFVECDNAECGVRRHVAYGHEETFCPMCGDPAGNTARPRVFCASLADVFEDWRGPIHHHNGQDVLVVPQVGNSYWLLPQAVQHNPVRLATMDDLRGDLFRLIDATPNLDWLLLTKRPENVRRMWKPTPGVDPHHPAETYDQASEIPYRHNVWLGTSISDQESADKQIPELLKCRDLASVLFLSIEPLLGPIDLTRIASGAGESYDALRAELVIEGDLTTKLGRRAAHRFRTSDTDPIDWVIVGGESGPQARPMHPHWVRHLRDQCTAAGVPFFFKQWGEWGEDRQGGIHKDKPVTCLTIDGHRNADHRVWIPDDHPVYMQQRGKKHTGRLLDGREWSEFPQQRSAVSN